MALWLSAISARITGSGNWEFPTRMFHVVPLGIDPEGYGPAERAAGAPFRVGFFARVAPEKGLHLLAESYVRLRRESDFSGSALEVAGYLAPEHRGYLRGIERRMKEAGLAHEFHYRGELDRAGKIEFLRSLSILSVPSTYDEPKGIFLLEAMASGVAVVQPRRGAFPEILERTGGGVMVEPGDAASLADGIYGLWKNPELAAELGRRGAEGVRGHLQRLANGRAGARSIPGHRQPHRPMLEISNVTKQYPAPRGPLTVLSGVSLALNRGEAAAIMGPSGAGKSTLLYIAGGAGTAHRRHGDAGRRQSLQNSGKGTGGISQPDHRFRLPGPLPAAPVLGSGERAGSDAGGERSRRGYPERARELLGQVGLEDRLDHRPAELSGGEKQRVALARCPDPAAAPAALRRADRQPR